jgi:DNA mismatch repair protein MutS2
VKFVRLLDAETAQVLGFEWLADALAPVSPYGERHFERLSPFAPGDEAQAESRAKAIADLAAALDADRLEAVRSALRELPDASGAIARASIGDVLDDPGLLELHRFCATIERIDALLAGIPCVSVIASPATKTVRTALAAGARAETGFYLSDAFDAELKTARGQLAKEQAEFDAARSRENARAARELGRDAIEADEFIVMRADLRGAVPRGVRVVREAPTYILCALEYGDATLAALERRDAAADVVAAAEDRVRTRLSSLAGEYAAELDAAAIALGALDVLLAAARFTQRHRCAPAKVTQAPVLAFNDARFLPIEAELAVAGRRFVPLDLELHGTSVLTGPNMGGKSVTLQTCGFVALCAAFGIPVPATRMRTGLFDQIAWLGLGREAHVGGLLSSFAREVVELKEILACDAPQLLILVDEFARTTTPHEGKALLVALLARLREREACGMVATHLAGIAGAAGVRHFAVRGLRGIPPPQPAQDVEEALAALAESMDYTIAEVSSDAAPEADAIALTALLGVDRDFVDAAYRALVQ